MRQRRSSKPARRSSIPRKTTPTPKPSARGGGPKAKAPREAQWFLQIAADLTQIAWVVTRDRSRIIYVGPASQTVYGTGPDALRANSMAWTEAVHPEDRERVETALVRRGTAPLVMEYRVVRPEGGSCFVNHRSVPLRDANGKLTHRVDLVAVVDDGVRMGLREPEEKYQTIFSSSPDYICITDTDGLVLDANPAFLERLGLRADELGRSNLGAFYAGQYRRRLLQALCRLRRGGDIRGLEVRVRTVEGSILYVEANATPLRHAGVVNRFLVLARDITERRRTEQSLTRKTRQQEQLLETAHQLASSLDAERVLARIAQRARSILNARACVLYLLEPDGKTLTPAVSTDAPHSDKVLSKPLKTEQSLTGQAVKARRGLIFNDAWAHPLGYQIPGTPEEEEERVIVVPLVADDRVLGAMCVNRLGELFGEEDLALAEAFGAYAAAALRNAQSHEAVRREAEIRKQAEKALAREREYYRSFVESLSDWAWEMDSHGVHSYSNRAVEKILGYPVAEVVGHHVTKLWCDEDKTRKNKAWLRRTLASGLGWHGFKARFRHKDGSVRILESTALAIRDAENRVVGYRGLDHDITDRARAEEALKSSEEKFRRLVENTDDILYSLERSGTITYASPGVRILGYAPDDMIGRNILEFLPAEDAKRAQENLQKAIAGESGYFEIAVRARDGGLRHIRSRVQQVTKNGKVTGLQGVATDITELRKAGEALRSTRRKLEALHVIAQRLEACPSADEVCRIAVGAAEKILDSYLCSCRLTEDDQLLPKAKSSRQTTRMFWDDSIDEELALRTYRAGQTFRFADESELPVKGAAKPSLKSGLSVPIGDLGVLQVFSPETHSFGADEARLAELLAGHVAQAIRRIRLQDDLKEQALRDPLTGVYNRYYINEILGREMKRSERMNRPVAFLMADVNGLKEINDRFGHQTGDRVLQATASLLQSQVRATDTVVRYGGDEFLAILLEAAEEAVIVAKRIVNAAASLGSETGLGEFPVTLSIGIASWDPVTRVPVEQILRDADDRMYEDKRKRLQKS